MRLTSKGHFLRGGGRYHEGEPGARPKEAVIDPSWLLLNSPLLLAAWLFLVLRPAKHSSLLPPRRWYAVPWGGPEILLVLALAIVLPSFVRAVVVPSGFFTWLYGPDAAAPALSQRVGLWITTFYVPLVCAAIVLVPAAVSGTRPYQLGLSTHRLPGNLLVGLLTAFCVNPFAQGVFLVITTVQRHFDTQPENHPIAEMAKAPLHWYEWVLIVVSTMAAAPVVEELLFRGLLQRWFSAERRRGLIAVGAAFALTVLYRQPKIAEAYHAGGRDAVWPQLAPFLFVLAMVPVYLLVVRVVPSPAAPGIFGTALLFGSAHMMAWPSPVPLFVLGLGLGLVAHRTQSLIPGIVAHSLFNGVACVQLLKMTQAPPP